MMSACVLPPERQGLVERVDDGGVADGAAVDGGRGPRDAAVARDFETLTDGAQSPDGAQGADAAQSPDVAHVADAAQSPDVAQVADAAQAPECISDDDCAAVAYCDSRGHCAPGCRVEPDNCAAGLSCVQGDCVVAPAIPLGYVRIEPGIFTMGSPADELGRRENEEQHQVTITRAFLMKTTEVTQAEWQAVVGNNPSWFAGVWDVACGDNCPVEQVSWNDAVDYVNALSDAAGLERCYDANRAFAGLECSGYRLPTEAEWEYAARAGTRMAYYTGVNTQTECVIDPNLDSAGWYCGNANNTTHPVGQKQANAWGLYDLHGNVSEWVQDWWGAYPALPVVDPVGPAAGSYRLARGGSWWNDARTARLSNRGFLGPRVGTNHCGVRPARTLP
jgi:formylglycine-generating enzyme required for sulfatase activity